MKKLLALLLTICLLPLGALADSPARFSEAVAALLVLPEDCLTDVLDLSRCHPGDWNATEAASW